MIRVKGDSLPKTTKTKRTIPKPDKTAERNSDVKQALANLRRKYGKAH